MIRIREFEERCAQLYGETKIRGFLHLYIGEEAIASGAVSCDTRPPTSPEIWNGAQRCAIR